jgi:hypothetical protein
MLLPPMRVMLRPGTTEVSSRLFVAPACSRSRPDTAVMLMGTSRMLSERFCAVTTTSSRTGVVSTPVAEVLAASCVIPAEEHISALPLTQATSQLRKFPDRFSMMFSPVIATRLAARKDAIGTTRSSIPLGICQSDNPYIVNLKNGCEVFSGRRRGARRRDEPLPNGRCGATCK